MFDFFRSANVSDRNASRFARLDFDRLEARDCPALLTFNAEVVGAHQVLLTGQLESSPEGTKIEFNGAVSGYAFTDSNGFFSFLSNDASLGAVFAVGVDQGVEISNTAVDDISSAPPIVWIDSVINDVDMFTFTGFVADEHTEGLIIRFGQAGEGLTAEVDADGNFTITCILDNVDYINCLITATTTDWWGQISNVEMRYIA